MKIGYGTNSWKQAHDQFVARSAHETALKTIAVAGFDSIEVPASTGRWDPMGNREWIDRHYGGVAGLRSLMSDCGIGAMSSYLFNPEAPIQEENSKGRNPLDPASHEAIAATVGRRMDVLAELGGDLIVAAAAPSWWRTGDLSAAQIDVLGACWTRAGAAARAAGGRLAVNIAMLSAIRTEEQIAALLAASDPETVGLSIDTAEAVIMGLDPLALLDRFADRVWHIQLKDALARDAAGEARQANAERVLLNEGGARGVERWFGEILSPGGLVEFEPLAAALEDRGYAGHLVVECEQTPNPISSVLLNGWACRRLFWA